MNRSMELIQLVASLSARASQNDRHVQILLEAMVRSAMSGAESEHENNSPGDSTNNHLIDWVKEQMEKSLDFDAPCEKILEGMREAIEAGNKKAAANAFFNYQRCMTRPRPLSPA
jgi:hypothetical protein